MCYFKTSLLCLDLPQWHKVTTRGSSGSPALWSTITFFLSRIWCEKGIGLENSVSRLKGYSSFSSPAPDQGWRFPLVWWCARLTGFVLNLSFLHPEKLPMHRHQSTTSHTCDATFGLSMWQEVLLPLKTDEEKPVHITTSVRELGNFKCSNKH